MKKTSCYVIALSFLTAAFFVMVSCNKDSVKVSGFGLQDYLDNNMTKSDVGLVIGKFTPDGSFVYDGTIEEILADANNKLQQLYGDTLSLEFFGIVDTMPMTDTCIPMVRCSFFNVYEGLASNVFTVVDKSIIDNDTVVYMVPGGHAPVNIICKQGNCNNDCDVVPSTRDKAGHVLSWKCRCPDRKPLLGHPHHCEQWSMNQNTTSINVQNLSVPVPR